MQTIHNLKYLSILFQLSSDHLASTKSSSVCIHAGMVAVKPTKKGSIRLQVLSNPFLKNSLPTVRSIVKQNVPVLFKNNKNLIFSTDYPAFFIFPMPHGKSRVALLPLKFQYVPTILDPQILIISLSKE